MGQIKNIKLHIVTDIKCKLDLVLEDHSLSFQPKNAVSTEHDDG